MVNEEWGSSRSGTGVQCRLSLLICAVWLTGAAGAFEHGPGTGGPGEVGAPGEDRAAGPSGMSAEPSPPDHEIEPAAAKATPAPPPCDGPPIVEDSGEVSTASQGGTQRRLPQLLTTAFQGVGPSSLIPADPILAVGPDHIVQCVNSRFRISTKDGTTVGGGTFSNWWGSLVPQQVPFDPWVVYDHFSDRWVMLAVTSTCREGIAWQLISTSFSSDPTGPWCKWALRADLDGDTDTDNRSDYPRLGLDETNFYLTTNQFACDGGFSYSKIRVMNKSQFYTNTCDEIEWYDFVDLRDEDGRSSFTVQPALTFGSPGREYLINAYSGATDLVNLWSITGTWPNPTQSPPVLKREVTVRAGAYTLPPNAQQCGGETPLHTGDARFMNAVYRDGQVFTCHAIEADGYAAARYLAIDVDDLTVTLDEAIGSPGYDYYYPAIMVDKDCNLVTVFNRSSAEFGECAGIRYSWRRPSDASFRESAPLKRGEAPYVGLDSGDRNRWGDYSGIAVDPSDEQIWVFGMFARAPAGSWGTWVGKLTVGSAPPSAVSLELKGVPDPPLTGHPFELRADISNQGPTFTGILINILYVAGEPTLAGVFTDIPLGTDSTLLDFPLLSTPQQAAPPGAFYLTLLYDATTGRIVMFDGLNLAPVVVSGSTR